jgi:hypothetical protein
MPRQAIMSMTHVSMDHFIYLMGQAFYVNMSWGQNAAYQTFKIILE